jgi:holin-like protein
MFASAVAAVLVCDLLGELLARVLRLPIPGAVLGMGLLLAALVVRGRPLPDAAAAAGNRLVGLLPFLFVPIGVAGCAYAALVRGSWLAVAAAIVVSVVVGIGVTVGVASLVSRMRARPPVAACTTS